MFIRVFAATLALLASIEVAPAELRVVCDLENRSLPLGAVEEGKLLLRDGESLIPAPADAHWRLEGDLRREVHTFRWSPDYVIRRWSGADVERDPQASFVAEVKIEHYQGVRPGDTTPRSPFLREWPSGAPSGGAMVCVWLVDGAVQQVLVSALPPATEAQSFVQEIRFFLSAAAAANGQPGLSLWSDGALQAPRPAFASEVEQQALAAVVFDDGDALKAAFAAGAEPSASSRDGISFVHYAAGSGASRVLDHLLTLHPKLASAKRLSDQATPLHWAARQGRAACAARLLAAKAPKNAQTSSGSAAVLVAATNGHTEVVRELIRVHAALSVQDVILHRPLLVAIDNGFADIADALFAAGVPFYPDRRNDPRVLLTQARKGHTGSVRWLLARGVDANAEVHGVTALISAGLHDDPDLARVLLAAGAQPNKANADGYTPLMAAANSGSTRLAATLIDGGADVNARTKAGLTALHFAAASNSADMIELLLSRRADRDATAAGGATALDGALTARAAEAARSLAHRGARIRLGTPQTDRLLESAIILDVAELVRFALQDGWSAAARLASGWPALRVAQITGATRTAAMLAEAGAEADPNDPMPLASKAELDQPLNAIQFVQPPFPRDADVAFSDQLVVVDVVVDSTGRPLFPLVRAGAAPPLVRSVLSAVSQWRFPSPTRNGHPVATRVRVPVRFKALDNDLFDESEVDEPPEIIRHVPAIYARAGVDVRVVLEFVVNVAGTAEDIRVIESTGEEFNAPAVAAVRKWRFSPGRRAGRLVAVRVRLPMIFVLGF